MTGDQQTSEKIEAQHPGESGVLLSSTVRSKWISPEDNLGFYPSHHHFPASLNVETIHLLILFHRNWHQQFIREADVVIMKDLLIKERF